MYSGLRRTQLLGRFYRNALFYGLGTLIARAGALLLLPVYWLKLSPQDFGVIGLCQVLITLLTPVLSLGLSDAVQRLYYDWPAAQRAGNVAVLYLLSFVFGLIACISLDVWGGRLFAALITQVPFDPLLRISLWTAFGASLQLIPLTLLRVREELGEFTVITVLSFLLQSTLALLLLFGLNMGVQAVLLSNLVNALVWSGYLVFRLPAQRMRPPWPSVADALRYAAPLVPAAVMEGLTATIDRLLLDKFVSLTQIGLYNLGNQFGAALNMFNQILRSAWTPFVYRVVSERSDGPAILGKFSVYYVAVLCLPALAVALLSKEFILMLGDERFYGVYDFVPAFVLAYLIQGTASALGRGVDIAKKTAWMLVVPAVSAFSAAAALYLLVPAFGVWGAVAAMLVWSTVRTLTHVALAVWFYPRPFHLPALAKLASITIAGFAIGHSVDTGNLALDVLAKLGAIAATALAIFWFALDRQRGLSLLRRFLRPRPRPGAE
jgi:O-antigen/teichoic acid export membrane protein